MENKFYTDDNFEQFLKDTTDNFRMYPSKKVWYSVYNNLHPSRKWPSLAVCLLLIFAILYIGITNNNSINKSKRAFNGNNYFAAETENGDEQSDAKEKRTVAMLDNNSRKNTTGSSVGQTGFNTASSFSDMLTQNDLSTYFFQDNGQTAGSGKIVITQSDSYTDPVSNTVSTSTKTGTSNVPTKASATIAGKEDNATFADTDLIASNTQLENNAPEAKEASANTLTKTSILKELLSKEDKEWIENYAYNNQASISKFKSRAAIQYYVTPSIGFRILQKNNKFDPPANQPTLVSSSNQPHSTLDVNDEVTQKSGVNMEAGVALLYNISKRTRFKAGLQFNYTSYISFANALKHPTQSYLVLNSNNGGYTMAPRLSGYANSITGDKNERLNNKTTQLSLPVGADFKLLGKDKVKWYAGATVQPSFTTGGQVYAISSDTKYYVEQNDLLRKWNVAAGLETFISYKTPGGIIINAGPQLRYQFLSTYKKQYSYTEKLYNVGVKLGLTKSF